jgi:hypothetical protein
MQNSPFIFLKFLCPYVLSSFTGVLLEDTGVMSKIMQFPARVNSAHKTSQCCMQVQCGCTWHDDFCMCINSQTFLLNRLKFGDHLYSVADYYGK